MNQLRRINIPEDLMDQLFYAARNVPEEGIGLLVYRHTPSKDSTKIEECNIEGAVLFNFGTIGNVRADSERVKVLEEFFERNPEYRAVGYHTHTQVGCERYGLKFLENWSPGDEKRNAETIQKEPAHIAMLVTPNGYLTESFEGQNGFQNPTLHTVSRNDYKDQQRRDLYTKLVYIANEMRVDIADGLLMGTLPEFDVK